MYFEASHVKTMNQVALAGWCLTLSLALPGSTGCVHGTPMHPICRELPSVEECLAAARMITGECLKKCVELQCAGVKVDCRSEKIRKDCEEKTDRAKGIVALGYVDRTSESSCDKPLHKVNWCEEPASRDCRAQAMVHELAHACGWRHDEGQGVPGDDGFLPCE
jgi:hypothetical protein